MNKDDTARLFSLGDIPAALGLLSRLPVPVDTGAATARGAAAAWAYPIAGLIIGVIVASVASAMLWIGLPVTIAAALAIATAVIITGAMHEDGLADSADGLWGGWDKARRLEIMKDSSVGVYGVTALALSLLIRWLAISAVLSSGWHWPVFIAVAALSRASMAVMMAALPNARGAGLSQTVGRPSATTGGIACGIAMVVALTLPWPWAVAMIVASGAATFACGLIARAKIGGQTGDILGATQQMTEMAMLLALVAMLT